MVEWKLRFKRNRPSWKFFRIPSALLRMLKPKKTLRMEIETLLDREELMWAQKARTKWFFHGDRNTKFFKQWLNRDELEVGSSTSRMIRAFSLISLKRLRLYLMITLRKTMRLEITLGWRN